MIIMICANLKLYIVKEKVICRSIFRSFANILPLHFSFRGKGSPIIYNPRSLTLCWLQ